MKSKNKILRVGSTVLWRGGFGREPEKRAKVTNIDKDCNGDKYGTDTKSIEWDKVNERDVVVGLDNGHWAYGDQIRPLTNKK
jgi:hypothetical protein